MIEGATSKKSAHKQVSLFLSSIRDVGYFTRKNHIWGQFNKTQNSICEILSDGACVIKLITDIIYGDITVKHAFYNVIKL